MTIRFGNCDLRARKECASELPQPCQDLEQVMCEVQNLLCLECEIRPRLFYLAMSAEVFALAGLSEQIAIRSPGSV